MEVRVLSSALFLPLRLFDRLGIRAAFEHGECSPVDPDDTFVFRPVMGAENDLVGVRHFQALTINVVPIRRFPNFCCQTQRFSMTLTSSRPSRPGKLSTGTHSSSNAK